MNSPSTPDAIVDATGIVVRFGDLTAVDHVDLQVQRGSIYGLLGPNGAGKTTLIRVLTTLLKPAAGSATVDGVDVLEDPQRARTKIGLAGQFAAVDEYQTGRENVEMIGRLYRLSRREARQRSDDILERIGLMDAADRQVGTYSGGMRRRLDLAASLIGRPAVMFLDEPTTGIDPRSRVDIWELIEDLIDSGTTVLLTTQYLEEADQLADRIGVIDEGEIVQEGTADELKDTLGGTIINVTIDPAHRADYEAALHPLMDGEATWDEERRRLRVPAHEGPASLMQLTRLLDEHDLRPEDITTTKPTLDDVFLSITGEQAQSDRRANNDAQQHTGDAATNEGELDKASQ